MDRNFQKEAASSSAALVPSISGVKAEQVQVVKKKKKKKQVCACEHVHMYKYTSPVQVKLQWVKKDYQNIKLNLIG